MQGSRYQRLDRTLARCGIATTGLLDRPDVSPSDVERALGEALELGADVIETAPYLGEGEKLCGRVVRELGAIDRVLVVTRVPAASQVAASAELLADDDGRIYRDPLVRAFSPASLLTCVEASLVATGLPMLPLCMLEGWHDSWLRSPAWPELAGAMAELTRAGKVGKWGVCVPRACVARATQILEEPQIAAVAAPRSLWLPSLATALARACHDRGVAFFAHGALGQGGLSGEIVAAMRFRPGDVRGEIFGDARGRVELSRRVAALAAFTKGISPAAQSSDAGRQELERSRKSPELRECRTLVELAVRFVLGETAVATAIIGCSSVPHVREVVAAAAAGELPEHVLVALEELLARWSQGA